MVFRKGTYLGPRQIATKISTAGFVLLGFLIVVFGRSVQLPSFPEVVQGGLAHADIAGGSCCGDGDAPDPNGQEFFFTPSDCEGDNDDASDAVGDGDY